MRRGWCWGWSPGFLVILGLLACGDIRVLSINLRSGDPDLFLDSKHDAQVVGTIHLHLQSQDVDMVKKAAVELDMANAWVTLGQLYELGHPKVPQDYKSAVLCYQQAANLGFEGGMYSLATMFKRGWGVERDLEAAAFWYSKAAEKLVDFEGFQERHFFSHLKFDGTEVKIKYKGEGANRTMAQLVYNESVVWDCNQKDAEVVMDAIMSSRVVGLVDFGPPRFSKLENQKLNLVRVGGVFAPFDLDMICTFKDRDSIPHFNYSKEEATLYPRFTGYDYMNDEEIAASTLLSAMMGKGHYDRRTLDRSHRRHKTFGKVVKWAVAQAQNKSLGQENGKYAAIVATLVQEGYGVKQSLPMALKMYKLAAEKGIASAMNNVGFYHERGFAVNKSTEEAYRWYAKAARAGDGHGMLNLGSMIERGLAPPSANPLTWVAKMLKFDPKGLFDRFLDVLSVRDWWERKTASRWRGWVRRVNAWRALMWYRKAAKRGIPGAMNNIGRMYAYGRGGLKKDLKEAKKWFRRGVEIPSGVFKESEEWLQNIDNDDYEDLAEEFEETEDFGMFGNEFDEEDDEEPDEDDWSDEDLEQDNPELDPYLGPGRNPAREALYNLGMLELIHSTAQGIHKWRNVAKWFALAAEKSVLDSDNAKARMI